MYRANAGWQWLGLVMVLLALIGLNEVARCPKAGGNCLPTHSWYCGIALLLAPAIAALLWNKGGWIQNRAFTLSIWCMSCQVFPMFVNDSIFAVDSVNDPNVNLVVSIVALVANVVAFAYIVVRSLRYGVNPYTKEIFAGTLAFTEAMERRAEPVYLLATEPASATEAEKAEMVAYAELPIPTEPSRNDLPTGAAEA